MNSDTPEGLDNSVFYYNGINFVLRGGQEHRNLCLVQFSFIYETDLDIPDKMLEYVDYVEFGSKNRPGGRKQLNLENKTVCHNYAQSDHFHVFLLKCYISKLPPGMEDKTVFYCKPLKNVPDDDKEPCTQLCLLVIINLTQS